MPYSYLVQHLIQTVSCYFTDHCESLDLTTIFSSSTFDNGHLNATVFVCSEYLGLAPDPCRVPPLVSFFHNVFKNLAKLLYLILLTITHINSDSFLAGLGNLSTL